MRKPLLILSFIMSIFVIVSCGEHSSYSFVFSYSLKGTNIHRGDHIEIEVVLKNDSKKQYNYVGSESDFRASVQLYCNETDYIIPYDPIPSATDIGKHSIAPGESRSAVFGFLIPQDAPCGDYNLRVSFDKSNQTFISIFKLS